MKINKCDPKKKTKNKKLSTVWVSNDVAIDNYLSPNCSSSVNLLFGLLLGLLPGISFLSIHLQIYLLFCSI